MITQKQIKELLHYNPETGIFTWLERTPYMFESSETRSQNSKCNIWNSRFAGKKAGNLSKTDQYIQISLFSKNYRAHFLAYLYMTGKHLKKDIDHVNGIRNDNRWINLRPATRSQNLQNAKIPKNNTSGYKSICFDKAKGKWLVRGNLNGKQIFLGYFDNLQDASKFYCEWAKKAFGKFFRAT
jgi:hypothetical protein